MDPLHPIIPVAPSIGPVGPLPATRRIERDGRRESDARRRARDEQATRRPATTGAEGGPDEGDERPHIDITA